MDDGEVLFLLDVVGIAGSDVPTNRAVHLLHARDVIGLGLRLGLVVLASHAITSIRNAYCFGSPVSCA